MWIENCDKTRRHQHKNKTISNIMNSHQPWSNKQNPFGINIEHKHHQTAFDRSSNEVMKDFPKWSFLCVPPINILLTKTPSRYLFGADSNNSGQAATRHFGTWRHQHLDGNWNPPGGDLCGYPGDQKKTSRQSPGANKKKQKQMMQQKPYFIGR